MLTGIKKEPLQHIHTISTQRDEATLCGSTQVVESSSGNGVV